MAVGQPALSPLAFSMTFNSPVHGGCFGAGSLVALADGTRKPIQLLRKGDLLLVPQASATHASAPAPVVAAPTSAKVVCVVAYEGVRTVQLPGSGLLITPWLMGEFSLLTIPISIVAFRSYLVLFRTITMRC